MISSPSPIENFPGVFFSNERPLCLEKSNLTLPLLIQIGFFHVQLFTRRTLFFVFVHCPLRCNVQSLPDKVFKIKLLCLVRRRTSTLTFKQYNILQCHCHIMQCNIMLRVSRAYKKSNQQLRLELDPSDKAFSRAYIIFFISFKQPGLFPQIFT